LRTRARHSTKRWILRTTEPQQVRRSVFKGSLLQSAQEIIIRRTPRSNQRRYFLNPWSVIQTAPEVIMKKTRRQFLQTTTGAAGALLAARTVFLDPGPLWAYQQPVAPSDRVRFGMVGVGMQGSGLLAASIELPGVECAAACDLYDGRHTLAKEIVRPDLP